MLNHMKSLRLLSITQYTFLRQIHQERKLYEEFYTENEVYELDELNSLGYIKTEDVEISFDQLITDFDKVFDSPQCNKLDINSVIKKYVPDFQHIETGKNLTKKM